MSEELERQGMDPVEAEEEKALPGRSLFEWLQTILGCVLMREEGSLGPRRSARHPLCRRGHAPWA